MCVTILGWGAGCWEWWTCRTVCGKTKGEKRKVEGSLPDATGNTTCSLKGKPTLISAMLIKTIKWSRSTVGLSFRNPHTHSSLKGIFIAKNTKWWILVVTREELWEYFRSVWRAYDLVGRFGTVTETLCEGFSRITVEWGGLLKF